MSAHTQRSWLSPFVALTFIAVSITGILMIFHIRFPGMYPLHEWGGVLFVIAGVVHLLLNWRAFGSYFKKKGAVLGLVVGAIALVIIAVAIPSGKPGAGGFHGAHNPAGYQGAYHQ